MNQLDVTRLLLGMMPQYSAPTPAPLLGVGGTPVSIAGLLDAGYGRPAQSLLAEPTPAPAATATPATATPDPILSDYEVRDILFGNTTMMNQPPSIVDLTGYTPTAADLAVTAVPMVPNPGYEAPPPAIVDMTAYEAEPVTPASVEPAAFEFDPSSVLVDLDLSAFDFGLLGTGGLF